jgi:hypothetical protein
MAITVYNKLRQPLTVTLNAKDSIHFLAKESKELTQEQFDTDEVQKYAANGDLVTTKID